MADETFDSEAIVLYDLWPASHVLYNHVPQDGFTGALHHNVATAVYPVGTKAIVRNHSATAGIDGFSTFIYLKLEMQDATNVLGPRQIVACHSDAVLYDVTNDSATDLGAGKGPIAIGLSAMTVDYYGWFWCGGVCPEEYVSALGGSYATDGTVEIGDMVWKDLASPGTTYGEFGFSLPAGVTTTKVGFAMSADA